MNIGPRYSLVFKIEYAMEAVKQGSCAVGVKSKEVAILLALKRASSELSAHQKKVFRIDDHIGIAIAGLTSDARVLSRFMRNECLNSKFAYDDSLPVSRLVSRVSARTQVSTQRYGRRPYGVGLLVAGYDDQGPHVYQTCPSANFYDCKAMAIGARSQSARTYLERNFDKFPESSLEELVLHGLYALRESLPQNTDLSAQNTAIAVVGKDLPFNELSEEETGRYLEKMGEDRRSKRTGDVLKEADEGGDAGTSGEPGEGGESQ